MKDYSNSKFPIIFELLDGKGITQKQFAEAIQVSAGNISDWKSGKSSPSPDALSKIAAYFNVTTDYLLGNDTNRANDPATNDQLKFALFGDTDVSDELLEEIKEIAKLQRRLREKK